VAGQRRRRLDWCRRNDDTWRRWTDSRHGVAASSSSSSSSQPLCLRVPGCRRGGRAAVADESAAVGATDQHADDGIDQATSLGDPRADDDVAVTSERTRQQQQQQQQQQHLVEQNCSVDLTKRKRKSSPRQAEVDGTDGDGWAPIDKEILVSIVERLSVSCLQPPTASSDAAGPPCEFRQPLTPTATPSRHPETPGSGEGAKRAAAVAPRPLLTLLSTGRRAGVMSGDVAPAQKARRLAVYSAGRRKSVVQRRVQVRDTWTVPPSGECRRKSSTANDSARHVWAPLEKSVVLRVIDHILVDNDDDDDDTETPRRRSDQQPQPSRRRWLQPPSLRHITASSMKTGVLAHAQNPPHFYTTADSSSPPTARSNDPAASKAAEASFKWKSNILRRMRKEQSSSGRWLDAVPGTVAATGS